MSDVVTVCSVRTAGVVVGAVVVESVSGSTLSWIISGMSDVVTVCSLTTNAGSDLTNSARASTPLTNRFIAAAFSAAAAKSLARAAAAAPSCTALSFSAALIFSKVAAVFCISPLASRLKMAVGSRAQLAFIF